MIHGTEPAFPGGPLFHPARVSDGLRCRPSLRVESSASSERQTELEPQMQMAAAFSAISIGRSRRRSAHRPPPHGVRGCLHGGSISRQCHKCRGGIRRSRLPPPAARRRLRNLQMPGLRMLPRPTTVVRAIRRPTKPRWRKRPAIRRRIGLRGGSGPPPRGRPRPRRVPSPTVPNPI